MPAAGVPETELARIERWCQGKVPADVRDKVRVECTAEGWRLYWADRNSRWHEYPDLPWARQVKTLLAEIDRDPTALFWG